jgi:hypothetical protein
MTPSTDHGSLYTGISTLVGSKFGGEQICFAGRGQIELINYGLEFEASSINIAGSGHFIDGLGNRLGFYPEMRVADLRTMEWNDRIRSFVITG